jgi:hypothetical protein
MLLGIEHHGRFTQSDSFCSAASRRVTVFSWWRKREFACLRAADSMRHRLFAAPGCVDWSLRFDHHIRKHTALVTALVEVSVVLPTWCIPFEAALMVVFTLHRHVEYRYFRAGPIGS